MFLWIQPKSSDLLQAHTPPSPPPKKTWLAGLHFVQLVLQFLANSSNFFCLPVSLPFSDWPVVYSACCHWLAPNLLHWLVEWPTWQSKEEVMTRGWCLQILEGCGAARSTGSLWLVSCLSWLEVYCRSPFIFLHHKYIITSLLFITIAPFAVCTHTHTPLQLLLIIRLIRG